MSVSRDMPRHMTVLPGGRLVARPGLCHSPALPFVVWRLESMAIFPDIVGCRSK